MLISIPEVLSKAEVAAFRAEMDKADWIDGKATAGEQSGAVKHNQQLKEDSTLARKLGDAVLDALARNETFLSAALPLKIFPPLFNRYQGGGHFGTHVDNAIRVVRGTPVRIRTDLSMTLFLSEPEEYEGGILVVEDNYGVQEVKLAAGDLVLYPSTSLHHVTPVTSGARVCSFFWLQSMVRDDGERTLLFDLDSAIRLVTQTAPDDPSVVQLTSVYHNLLRRWADV